MTMQEMIQELNKRNEKLTSQTVAKKLKDIRRFQDLLRKNSHLWGENASSRMFGWVDDLATLINNMRRNHKADWINYCENEGISTSVTAYDSLA